VHHLLSRRILFFGGKGGVGKTTCAAALALAASRRGKRVLLASTDPAHSTSDVFGVPIGPTERELQPNLWALEIDPETEARRYLDEAKRRMSGIFSPGVLKEAARQIELTASMPGVTDVALFERMAQFIAPGGTRFDLVVFDTAPTGHSLRLLRLPEMMGTWVEALAARRRAASDAATQADGTRGDGTGRSADPVLEILEARIATLTAVRAHLGRPDDVAFVLVLIPERLPIEESARAVHLLEDAGVHLGGLVINRVLPAEAEGGYFRARKAQEAIHLAEIDRRLPRVTRAVVPQFESDVQGFASLERVSRHLLGGAGLDDPLRHR
jgi:arsenite/tail-anchored protein-transporting ATPase